MSEPTVPRASSDRCSIVALLALLLVALGLRLTAWPAPGDVRDFDELSYSMSGLALWEGLRPGHGVAPAGLTTWTTWTHAAVLSAVELARWPPDEPAVFRPFAAVDRALFRLHADLRSVRCTLLVVSIALSLSEPRDERPANEAAASRLQAVPSGKRMTRESLAATGGLAASLGDRERARSPLLSGDADPPASQNLYVAWKLSAWTS